MNKMKFLTYIKYASMGVVLLLGLNLFADIEQDRTNRIGDSNAAWQTGLMLPSDADADAACSVIAGLPFSCTLPASGGGSVTCTPVSIPGGLTLSSGCVLAGTSASDISLDVEFDDGVSDAVTKTINLTAGPNQSPSVADPTGCSAPKSGIAWSCDLASSVSDPEGQPLSYSLGSSAPSWASLSGSTLSGTPTSSGSVGVPYDVSDSVNIVSYTYNINIAVGTAEALEGDDPVSIATLDDAGVSTAITTALNTNTCGATGDQSCLTAFNNKRATSACSLAGGSSASTSQMEEYVECVVYETYTADASGVATTPASESAASGCGTSANVPLPPMCGYTAWTCPITNLPAGWVNNGQTVTIPDSASSTNVTLNVEMRLASWTNHLIKTVSQPVNVSAAIAGATNGYKLYNEDYFGGRFWDVWAAYDACQNRGGDLATLSEAASSGVLGGANQYYGQKEGSTTRPVNTSTDWTGTSGTDYKAAQDGGSQKYISSRSSASYVCGTKTRTGSGCGSNGASTKYYVCKNLPSCN
jgi:hypothetical protein